MTKPLTPFLHHDEVVIPRPYLLTAGGSVTVRATSEWVTVESTRETTLLQESSSWQCFSAQDPLLSLCGCLDDEASDVSRNKYTYLANAYRQ